MTATTFVSTRTTTESRSTTKHVWKTGLVAGAAASVATTLVAAAASAVDGPLTVGGEEIPWLGFAQLTMIGSVIGTMLAVVLARRARRPQHTFVITTVALTALSIVPDALADATNATRFALALTHLVAASIVIPALAGRLSN